MPRLIIYEDSEQSETIFETFELSDHSILIGSDPDNHLILQTPDIDSSHASLELRNNEWILQDLGGPGGTAVNGETIEGPHSLFHDDLIEVGFIKMRFQDPERGITKEFPRSTPPAEDQFEQMNEHEDEEEGVQVSGRIWFATVATATIAVIFIIIFLLIFAQVLGVVDLGGLISP